MTNKLKDANYQPGNRRQKRSTVSEEGESEATSDYDESTPVFERLGPKRIQPTTTMIEDHHFGPQLGNQKEWRSDTRQIRGS